MNSLDMQNSVRRGIRSYEVSNICFYLIIFELLFCSFAVGIYFSSFIVGVIAFFSFFILLCIFDKLKKLFFWFFSGVWGVIIGAFVYSYIIEYEPEMSMLLAYVFTGFLGLIGFGIALAMHEFGFMEADDYSKM